MRRRNRRKKQRGIIIASVVCLTFIMVTAYSAFSTTLTIGAKGNVVDRSRTIQSWTSSSNEDFHTDFYRENIVSATFLDSAKVPSDKVDSWDVSVDKDGGVMAYVVESSSETGKYDLFIGAKDGVIANEDSSYLFRKFTNLRTIDFGNNFDTSGVVNMKQMFNHCLSINNLDVSNFNTSNVTDMSNMFMACSSLTSLDLSNFNTSNVTNMSEMFTMWNYTDEGNGTGNLTTINLSGFDTSKVTEMNDMFSYNRNLNIIVGLENFDTSKVTNMWGLFYECESLNNLNLSRWDTSNVTTMRGMFQGCQGLNQLNLCGFNTSKVTNMEVMFMNTNNLTKIKVGLGWATANASTGSMFHNSGVSSVTTGEC